MSTNPRPRQARVTDQDLRALISRIDHIDHQLTRILEQLNPQTPRTATTHNDQLKFLPGTGPLGKQKPSDIQRKAEAALDARDQQQPQP